MRHPLAALALAALAGCSTSLDRLPDGGVVTCSADADCPDRLLCSTAGRCVAVRDDTPPDLVTGTLAVTPPAGRKGTPFEIAFDVNDDLEATPVVRLAYDGALAIPCAPGPARHWSCRFTASGDENGGAGGLLDVDVRMTDRAGNTRAVAPAATLRLDFAAPAVSLLSVAYVPAADNPLPAVARARDGTRVRVALTASEALAPSAPPALEARSGASVLPLALVPGSLKGADAIFEAAVTGALPDGDYVVHAVLTDDVGNPAALDLNDPVFPRVRVKTSTPQLLVNQAALVYLRAPQGSATTEDLGGGRTLPAGPYFGVEPADPLQGGTKLPAGALLLAGGGAPSQVLVQDAAGLDALTLGTLRPDAGLFPRQRLVSPDLPAVWLAGFDDAGNRSAAVRLDHVEWVATANPPAGGTSPLALLATPLARPTLVQPEEPAPSLGAASGGRDTDAVLARAVGTWAPRDPAGTTPVAREFFATAYDPARGRLVLHGGATVAGTFRIRADTWEWDGTAWRDVTPLSGGPGPRWQHAMAYDAARRRVVLFGGAPTSSGSPLDDTWEWDGAQWTKLAPAVHPPARQFHAMAYDPGRKKVVMFGGNTLAADVWEWDGTSWANVTPASGGPGPRNFPRLAFVPSLGKVISVGGTGSGAGANLDVWAWDGTAWTDGTPAVPGPSQRERFGLAYDARGQRALVFGGVKSGPGQSAVGETWAWSAGGWSLVSDGLAAPPPRTSGELAYDVARQRVVLFGGFSTSSALGDTWELDGGAWTESTPTGARPSARNNHALAYDSRRRQVVLYGGTDANGALLADQWTWNGARWALVGAAMAPGTRQNRGLAYDDVRDRLVLAGSGSGTWEWDGAAWTDRSPATSLPGGWLVHDTVRHRTVGCFVGPLAQEWDGTAWTARAAPPACLSAATFAPGLQRVVLWNDYLSPTQLFDGTAWTSVAFPAGQPPGRAGAALAQDLERGRTVLFGGENVAFYQDTWEFDGATWRDATPSTGQRPPARRFHTAAYDAARRQVVTFGGSETATFQDTWVYTATADQRPAIHLEGRLPDGVVGAVTGLRFRAHAGGRFATGAPGSTGAALVAWSDAGGGGWAALASNLAGVNAQAPWLAGLASEAITWTAPDPAAARALLGGRDGAFAVEVRPLGTMGSDVGGAAVALDDVEVRVDYTLP